MRLTGCVEIYEAVGRRCRFIGAAKNLFMCEGADAVAKILSGQDEYIPAYMYLEFVNGVAPSLSFTADEGRAYYAGLETSGPPSSHDYLRVPLLRATDFLTTDADLYDNNVIRFKAQSSGTAGIGGTTFSAGAGSKVFSAALVSAPDPDDRTQDLVFARVLFADAYEKPAVGEILITWPYTIVGDL